MTRERAETDVDHEEKVWESLANALKCFLSRSFNSSTTCMCTNRILISVIAQNTKDYH